MKIELSNFKCLVFDLDDTLVASSQIYDRVLDSIGMGLNKADYKIARSEIKETIGEGHVSARNRLLYFKRVLEMQRRFSPALNLEMMARYEDQLEKEIYNSWVALNRDALFSKLARSYSLGIVSNENTRTQLIKLRAIDPLGKYFKWVVFSEDVGVEKPSHKIFSEFFKRSGFRPAECCMIGDSVDCDLTPSKALGMGALLTKEFVNSDFDGENVIYKLEDLSP